MNLKILQKILSREYDVLEATGGDAALALLAAQYNDISAVVLDLRMPKTDGFAVIRQMRESPMLEQIPVIVTAGDSAGSDEVEALSLGANDFAVKPYHPEIIRHRLRNLIHLRETAALVNAARTDALTGLYSRSAFFEAVAQRVAAQPDGYYVMACFDVDNFKVINDRYGSEKGDEVLRFLATIFRDGFAPCGGICCRMNADIFAVLYPAAFMDTKENIRIRQTAAKLHSPLGTVCFSIGRYLIRDRSLSPSAMFDRASIARCAVKGRLDRQIAMYDASMLEKILREQKISSEAKPALDANRFSLRLQPQYNHITGALVGAEALVRWRHPQNGLIPPEQFIPIFEKNGFLYTLDQFVWRRACQLLRRWLDAQLLPVPVSVNLSPGDLLQPDFFDGITGLLAEYQIPAELLRFEITESAFAQAPEALIDAVKRLTAQGFVVEIDDFESGCSSLNTLKNVPAQIVKLDMRFLAGTDSTNRGGSIVESVVRMTKWLGMTVIAEGVESGEQADFLKSIGCCYVQGFLYGEPMPEADYELLLRNSRKENRLCAVQTVEKLDPNAFWDPTSMDTLIFNSYVGGACIFEWHNNKIELLRVNDKYAKTLLGAQGSAADARSIVWEAHMDEAAALATKTAIEQAIATGDEVTYEADYDNLPGTPGKTYLRTTFRVIAKASDRFLIYGTNENITAEREAANRLHCIISNLNGGVCAATYHDNNAKIIFANDQFYNLYGYTKEQFEMELSSPLDPIHPADRDFVAKKLEHLVRTGESVVYDFRCICRDGSTIYIRCNNTLTAMSGIGEAVLLSITTDITEATLAVRKELATAQKLQAILANINGGVSGATVSADGVMRLVFANDRFFSIYGYTRAEYEAEITDGFLLMVPDDRPRVREIMETIARTRQHVSETFRCRKRDGATLFVRVNLSLIDTTDVDETVFLFATTDITVHALAEQKRAETDEQLRLLNEAAHMLLSRSDVDEGIRGVLQMTLDYFNGDRAYVIEFDDRNRTVSNTYEVCAQGIASELANLQEIPMDMMPFWREALARDGVISIPDVDALDSSRIAEQQLLKAQGIRSLAAVPMLQDGVMVGFVGVDDPRRQQSDIAPLRAIGDYLAATIVRRNLYARIESNRQDLLRLMNDTPGGFARIRIRKDGTLSTDYINEALCRARGMSYEAVMTADSENAMLAVHPDDAALVASTVQEMLETGEPRNIQYRLRHNDGSYIHFNVFGRITKNDADEAFINAYYADLTAQNKKDLSMRDTIPYVLSTIMASSADLTFAKDKEFRYICCSNAFAHFAGQASAADIIGRTDFELFPQETAEQFRRDDLALFENGKSLIDYLEPIPSADGVQHYATTSKYILRDTTGAVIGLYGMGRDVTEYRTAFDHLRLLTDNIPGGIASFLYAPEGIRLTYFNDGYCNMLGFSRDEYELICQNSVTSLTFEEDVAGLLDAFAQLRDGASSAGYTYRVHNRYDDGFKWVDLRASVSERRGDKVQINTMLFDVTEAKLAEEALRIHEEEMKLALSKMGRMIAEYDIESRTLRIPDTYATQYGLPQCFENAPESVIRDSRITDETAQQHLDFYAAIVNGKNPAAIEVQRQSADGTLRWERLTAFTLFGDDGKPVKALIASDDTTQQHLQYELERSRPTRGAENMLFHALFNLSTLETLEYRDRNEMPVALEKQMGVLGSDRPTKIQFLDAAESERFHALHNVQLLREKFAQGETEFSIDYRRRMPDGEILWVRNILRTLRKPGGNDILLFEYCYNIEDEKLRELMSGALVSTSYDYVARIHGKTKKFSIITNRALRTNLPPVGGDDVDKAALEIANRNVHPEDRDMVIANTSVAGIHRNLEHREMFQFTCRMLEPDGSVCYKKLTSYYLDRTLDIMILSREDITQIMEEEHKKNAVLAGALEAANQASQAKTTFLSRMSHELRTPMNAIIGLVTLSATDMDNPRVMEDNIAKIGISARYLLSLINDILEMSRIESGKLTLSEAPFDFERFIANLNTIITAQTAVKGIEYEITVNSYLEPRYEGDCTKLQEILVNVLGNAVKFTPAGGKITLAIEQLRRVRQHATLRFVVRDTGVGIDKAFLPHLFDSFSQESDNLTSGTTGTGLGLAITKSLVEMMHGSISVQSMKNVGSVFTIDVQLGVCAQSRPYLERIAALHLSDLRVLIVDDDDVVCRSTQRMLEAIGVTAEWADSGALGVVRVQEALQQPHPFDAVFVDWKMPDMDGMETTREIRRIAGPAVRMIIVTAYDRHGIEAEATEAGVNLFLEKPLFQSTVVKAFEQLYAGDNPDTEPAADEKFDFTGKRFLLAEDNALNVEIARRLLERNGAEVVAVNNGLEAIETYTTAPDGFFDLILMDIRMPVMDGLTATRNIRKLRKSGSREIPIVAMTANAFDEDVELSLDSGMDAHLAKPIEPQVMYATLHRLLQK